MVDSGRRRSTGRREAVISVLFYMELVLGSYSQGGELSVGYKYCNLN